MSAGRNELNTEQTLYISIVPNYSRDRDGSEYFDSAIQVNLTAQVFWSQHQTSIKRKDVMYMFKVNNHRV